MLLCLSGARDCGYSSSAHGMFPRGGTELALHFYKKSNKELIAKLDQDIADIKKAESDVTKLPTGKLVRDAIEARIR